MSKTITMSEVVGPEGHWLVVVRGEVVAHSDSAKMMFTLAEKYPAEDTTVTRIPSPQASFY